MTTTMTSFKCRKTKSLTYKTYFKGGVTLDERLACFPDIQCLRDYYYSDSYKERLDSLDQDLAKIAKRHISKEKKLQLTQDRLKYAPERYDNMREWEGFLVGGWRKAKFTFKSHKRYTLINLSSKDWWWGKANGKQRYSFAILQDGIYLYFEMSLAELEEMFTKPMGDKLIIKKKQLHYNTGYKVYRPSQKRFATEK